MSMDGTGGINGHKNNGKGVNLNEMEEGGEIQLLETQEIRFL